MRCQISGWKGNLDEVLFICVPFTCGWAFKDLIFWITILKYPFIKAQFNYCSYRPTFIIRHKPFIRFAVYLLEIYERNSLLSELQNHQHDTFALLRRTSRTSLNSKLPSMLAKLEAGCLKKNLNIDEKQFS